MEWTSLFLIECEVTSQWRSFFMMRSLSWVFKSGKSSVRSFIVLFCCEYLLFDLTPLVSGARSPTNLVRGASSLVGSTCGQELTSD